MDTSAVHEAYGRQLPLDADQNQVGVDDDSYMFSERDGLGDHQHMPGGVPLCFDRAAPTSSYRCCCICNISRVVCVSIGCMTGKAAQLRSTSVRHASLQPSARRGRPAVCVCNTRQLPCHRRACSALLRRAAGVCAGTRRAGSGRLPSTAAAAMCTLARSKRRRRQLACLTGWVVQDTEWVVFLACMDASVGGSWQESSGSLENASLTPMWVMTNLCFDISWARFKAYTASAVLWCAVVSRLPHLVMHAHACRWRCTSEAPKQSSTLMRGCVPVPGGAAHRVWVCGQGRRHRHTL